MVHVAEVYENWLYLGEKEVLPVTLSETAGIPVRLSFDEHGSGPAVVLLHGLCGSRAYWKPIVGPLSKRFRVIVPDLRGHGLSPAPEGKYTMESMAADVIQLLDDLNVDRAVLIGHSLGGYVTLAAEEAWPDRLAGWALVHSTAYPDDEQAKHNRTRAIASIRAEGVKPFVDDLVTRLFAPGRTDTMPDIVENARAIGYGTPAQGAIGALEGMRERPDRLHVLKGAVSPVALIAGARDQIVPIWKTHAFESPNVWQYTLPEAGHMGMFETPGELADMLEAHASRCMM